MSTAEEHDVTPVAVVGAGFSGLATAAMLKREGVDDFVVLERADDVGGTWRDNTYPGAACDVPSRLYSFGFDLNPNWSRSFSPQQEIWDYLRDCARSHDLLRHIRFGTELLDARWDDVAGAWLIETTGGSLSARVLVNAAGPLSAPAVPALPGLDSFAGTTFHSAAWNHDHDLTGRRVAVIGTGASAAQFVPCIQPMVEQLSVFQRTPPWILPRADRAVTGLERRLYAAVPALQRLTRTAIYVGRESYVLGFTVDQRILRLAQRTAQRHLERQVPDPALRAKLTPDYTLGCKRIVLSSDYYPALCRDNVDVVTEPIERVTRDAVVTADGTAHEVDTIIFGTGFRATRPPIADRIRDAGGRTLAEVWHGRMRAYKGTTVAGFPNLFWLLGPNTGGGHTSVVLMSEAQIRYVREALRFMRGNDVVAVDVRPEAMDRYDAAVQRRMQRTVWIRGGCSSWYLDENGRNTTLWPGFVGSFRRRTRRFDRDAYRVDARPRADVVVTGIGPKA